MKMAHAADATSALAPSLAVPTRFAAIDALRGVAAVSVVVYHYVPVALHATVPWASAYLAVDLFLMLSGFVIALSYEGKFARGMGAGKFMWRRMVRLYPLALLGMAAAGSALIAGAFINHFDHVRTAAIMRDVIKGIAFLPRVHGDDFAFPINPPMWSLFFEVVINLLYGLVVTQLSTNRLRALCALAAIGVVATAFAHGNLDMGSSTRTFLGGTSRAFWGFSIGVLLYRLFQAGRLDILPVVSPALLALAYLACCTIPYRSGASSLLAAAVVVLIFPLITALAIRSTSANRIGHWCGWLGELSYPMYVLHWGMMDWAFVIGGPGHAGRLLALTFLSLWPLSWLAARYWDRPVRTSLGRLAIPPRMQSARAL